MPDLLGGAKAQGKKRRANWKITDIGTFLWFVGIVGHQEDKKMCHRQMGPKYAPKYHHVREVWVRR
jgi:hypothetical protein